MTVPVRLYWAKNWGSLNTFELNSIERSLRVILKRLCCRETALILSNLHFPLLKKLYGTTEIFGRPFWRQLA